MITKEKVTEVKNQLQKACDDVLDLKSILEGLHGTAALNAQNELEKLEAERVAAEDAYKHAPNCNWFTAIFTLGIDCIIKAMNKKKAEMMHDQIKIDKMKIESTLTPLIAKIKGFEEVGKILWAAGMRKVDAVNNFLDAITAAESYF